MLRAIAATFFPVLFPNDCTSCGGPAEDPFLGPACSICWQQTRIFTGDEMLCRKCGSLLGEKKAPIAVSCRQCDDHAFDKAFAAGVYEKGLSAQLIRLKTEPDLSGVLSRTIIAAVERHSLSADLIIPVPLSKRRSIERGFNQAESIADVIDKNFGIAIDTGSLARGKHTGPHRIGMDAKARTLSIKNAFTVPRPKMIAGKRILLVDDVMTSGATASGCAAVLKKNGASEVNVFTAARAVMDRY